jgi:hypothetical protein
MLVMGTCSDGGIAEALLTTFTAYRSCKVWYLRTRLRFTGYAEIAARHPVS